MTDDRPRPHPWAWDHNAWYHRTLLHRVPPGPLRVLDVGCGAGALAVRLARRGARVDALDVDPGMVAAARARVPPSVRVVRADVLRDPLPGTGYDAVVSVSALHHLPLDLALPRLARSLRPGGVLVAVALPRTDLPRDLPVEAAAYVTQRVLAVGLRAVRVLRLGHGYAHEPTHAAMPVAAPALTVREVRDVAARHLPGARVRRLLLWRYLLVWRAPLQDGGSSSSPGHER
ncbi:class I SAM-dependent methyltransferase [Vallicoccus soli]|uniref:Class I SAM-dependent methyltransferase n=1 Tax=Vallicoccus soli TaxID=2339232 RepID=A0A3A3YTR4_9ACTN|nr:class I SAM-dependent methyltransferase [Vallicoccus soli]RJK94874.1 class I SAM-dependent methyltransferase [Vallicoccus soli]